MPADELRHPAGFFMETKNDMQKLGGKQREYSVTLSGDLWQVPGLPQVSEYHSGVMYSIVLLYVSIIITATL